MLHVTAELRRVQKRSPYTGRRDSIVTPRQKAKRREYYRKRRANMTPGQLDAKKGYQREYARKRRASMTPEQLAAYNAHQREHQRKRRASMTPEELDAQKARQRNYERKWRATRTSSQLEQIPPGLNRGDSQSGLAEGVCRH
jgi:hypothetical protein